MVREDCSTQNYRIILGPKLRCALRRELRALLQEWNCAHYHRRQEIKRQITLIYEILDEVDHNG